MLMMHILIIHQAFTSLNEPGGTRHHEIARYLARQGHKVTVIAGQVSYLTGKRTTAVEQGTREVDDVGVEIRRSLTFRGWHKSFVWRVVSFLSFTISSVVAGLQVRDVDIVWGTSPPIFQGASAWLISRLKRVPFLFEIRDLWPSFAIDVGVLRNPTLIRLSEWLEGFLYQRADRIVVNSPGFIDHIRSHGVEDIKLVPNGTDVEFFSRPSDAREAREQWGVKEQFLILYTGAHGLSNDLGIILDGAAQLKERSEIVFGFLGDGKEKQGLIERVERDGLGNVVFRPPVPKVGMARELAGADACIAILKPLEAYKTTYPNKVFDYMAAGKPVLLMIDGVIRQVVEEAGAGLFVPPGNPEAFAQAVLRLAENREKSHQMGRAGQEHVSRHFDRTKIAADMAQVIETTVSSNPSD